MTNPCSWFIVHSTAVIVIIDIYIMYSGKPLSLLPLRCFPLLCSFTPTVPGAFRHPPLGEGGGAVKRPWPTNRELIAAAKQARRQTKACYKL